jgi:hypothetical protein
MKKIALLFILLYCPSCSQFVFYALPEEKFSEIEREYFTISNEVFPNSTGKDLLFISFSIKKNENINIKKIEVDPLLTDISTKLILNKIKDYSNSKTKEYSLESDFNNAIKQNINQMVFFYFRSSSSILKSKSLKLKYRIEFDDGKVFEEDLNMVMKKIRDRRSGVLF